MKAHVCQFEDPKSRDRELKHTKNKKNGNFWVENLLIMIDWSKVLFCFWS